MALKVGTTSIVRLRSKEKDLRYGYWGNTLPAGQLATPIPYNPEGASCQVLDTWVSYNGPPNYTNQYYFCVDQGGTTEMTNLTIGSTVVHKRVSIIFDRKGGTGGNGAQTRTWGVEQVTAPGNPTKSGFTFQGWSTSSTATRPDVTFPRIAPMNDTTYYAVWANNASLTWQYDGESTSSFCFGALEPVIGTSCSTVNQTQIVPGAINGYGSQCIVVKCR